MLEKRIELILKISPLVFGFLTALGYIHLQIYYCFFGINLINHLELSEIPLLLYNNIIIIIGILFIIIWFSYYRHEIDEKELKEKITGVSPEERIEQLEKVMDQTTSKSKKFDWGFGIFLILGGGFIIISDLITENYIGLLFPFLFLLTFFVLHRLNHTALDTITRNLNSFSIYFIYICISAFLFLNVIAFTNAIEDGYEKRYTSKNVKNSITFEYYDKKIKTDSTLIYIGQTKKSLFLFDRKEEKILVFKEANIEHFVILLK